MWVKGEGGRGSLLFTNKILSIHSPKLCTGLKHIKTSRARIIFFCVYFIGSSIEQQG